MNIRIGQGYLKVTTPADLALAEYLISKERGVSAEE